MAEPQISFEIEDLPKDPSPGKTPPRTKRSPGRPAGSTNEKTEIRENIEMALTFGGMVWMSRDPECAIVFEKQKKKIAQEMTELAIKNERFRRWLGAVSAPSGFIGLGMALAPVAQQVYSHHIATPMVNQQSRGKPMPHPTTTGITVDS